MSKDNIYLMLKEKIKKDEKRKEKWTMCKILEYVMNKGIGEGREEGIYVLIRDNLEMGQEKETILEKIIRYFSVSREHAIMYYVKAVAI